MDEVVSTYFYIKKDDAHTWFDENLISLEEYAKKVEIDQIGRYLDREDGPAYKNQYLIMWCRNGMLHRIGGAAVFRTYLNIEIYSLWDTDYSKEDYMEAMEFLKENGDLAFRMKYYKA